MSTRTFRRYAGRYEENGPAGLADRRREQISHRSAPADEVMALEQQYRARHTGWNAKHFYGWYRRGGGKRGYHMGEGPVTGSRAYTQGSWARQPSQEARAHLGPA